MKHTLKSLYELIGKKYPELKDEKIYQYCNNTSSTSLYHYGYNSLKWAVLKLRETVSDYDLKDFFYRILLESKCLNKSFEDLQNNILSYPASARYKSMLKGSINLYTIVEDLNTIELYGYKILLNDTPHNLTKIGLGEYGFDGIIFKHQETMGFVLNKKTDLYEKINHGQIMVNLSPNWSMVSEKNRFGLMINKHNPPESIHEFIKILAESISNETLFLLQFNNNSAMYEDILEAIEVGFHNAKHIRIKRP